MAATEAKSKQQQWRGLSANDIESLAIVADTIHPILPERDEVFAERANLFPEGCLALINDSDQLVGYAISHPIKRFQTPSLDTLLGQIDPDADQYYIHDLAILPEYRGAGFARVCIDRLLAVGREYETTCLISVYGTERFWERFGFVKVEVGEELREKSRDYGDDAVYLERKSDVDA